MVQNELIRAEVAKNNRASCQLCNERIAKGTPKLVVGTWNGEGSICYKCAPVRIDEIRKRTSSVKGVFNRLRQKCEPAIIVHELKR